jgi:hypothetical protein
MEKYNENSASEMLTRLMDNELSDIDKKKILDQLESNHELKIEQEEHQKIRDVINQDEDSFKPPIAATTAVFGTLGMNYPVEATGASFLLSAFLKKYWLSASLTLIAVLSTLFYFFEDQTNENEIMAESNSQEITTPNNPPSRSLVSVSKQSENINDIVKATEVVGSNSNSNGNSSLDNNDASSSGQMIHNTPVTWDEIKDIDNSFHSKTVQIAADNKNDDEINSNLNYDQISNGTSLLSGNVISDILKVNTSSYENTPLNSNFANASLITVPYQKYTYYTDVHKESIFNLGINGFNSQNNSNIGIGANLSLNVSRVSPQLSSYISQIRLGVLSENITNIAGQSDFGNSRVFLSAKINPELTLINKLNTDFGRPIIEIGVGSFQEITPVISVGYSIRTILNSEIELKYTQFGTGIIGIGISKGF